MKRARSDISIFLDCHLSEADLQKLSSAGVQITQDLKEMELLVTTQNSLDSVNDSVRAALDRGIRMVNGDHYIPFLINGGNPTSESFGLTFNPSHHTDSLWDWFCYARLKCKLPPPPSSDTPHPVAHNSMPLVDRQATLAAYLQYELDRFVLLDCLKTVEIERRFIDFLIAVHGPPGSGKTRLIDELSSLHASSERIHALSSSLQCPSDYVTKYVRTLDFAEDRSYALVASFLDQFKGSRSISITFNNLTPKHDIDREYPREALGLRILFGSLCDSRCPEFRSRSRWGPFADQAVRDMSALKPFLHPREVLSFLRSHHQVSRLNVFIDELLKADHTDQVLLAVTDCLAHADAREMVSFVISSLSPWPLMLEKSSSGRPIRYLHLTTISTDTLFSCLPASHYSHPIQLYQNSKAFRLLLAHTSGHPLTVELVLQLCRKWSKQTSLQEMVAVLADDVADNARFPPLPAFDTLVPALLSTRVHVDEASLRLVTEGWYINSFARSGDSFVPVISLINLARFARSSVDEVSCPALVHLRGFFDAAHYLPFFKAYEHMHARWECLREALLRLHLKKDYCTLSEFYSLDTNFPLCSSSLRDAMECQLSLPRNVQTLTYHWPTSQTVADESLLSSALLPGDGNPGFDLVLASPSSTYRLVELRFSSPESGTTASWTEVTSKLALINSRPLFQGERRWCLVFACLRRLNGSFLSSYESAAQADRDRVVILDREKLLSLYGSSLSNLPNLLHQFSLFPDD
eukprot:GILI01012480.1.p1 GENE.GILI01012480.1~~GILI01012480.1.p1  ORF type:complete len:750 (-),score=78.62 GILI01012480.1:701-2950(-)